MPNTIHCRFILRSQGLILMPLKTNHLWQNTNTQAWDMLSWKKISSNDRFKQRFEVCQEILYFKLCMFFLYINAILIVADLFQSSAYYYPLRILGKKNWVSKNQVYSFWIGWKFWTSELNECSMNDYRVLEKTILNAWLSIWQFQTLGTQTNSTMKMNTWS